MTERRHRCPECRGETREFGSGRRCVECTTVYVTDAQGRITNNVGTSRAVRPDTTDTTSVDLRQLDDPQNAHPAHRLDRTETGEFLPETDDDEEEGEA